MQKEVTPDLRNAALLLRSGRQTCALPLDDVVEIMRPQPVQEVAHAPEAVCGVSVIRGAPVPVVSLCALLGESAAPAGRFVLLRVGRRRVALAVSAVSGIAKIEAASGNGLPPLLRGAARSAIDSISALDSDLLLLLKTIAMVPEDSWPVLEDGQP